MTTKKGRPSDLTKALLESAKDMHKSGILTDAAYEKITLRHLGEKERAPAKPITGPEIRAMRERANMSQAVFAHHLGVTVDFVSKLERGARRPTGPALTLLRVIHRKGIDAIL